MRLSPRQNVVFVTGKGGVGKSTISAALARAEADRTGRSVLVEFEGATSAERALAGQRDGIETIAVEYLDALSRTIGDMLRSRVLARVVVRQRALRHVLRAVPAIRELVALDRVRQVAQAAEGARVFVDLPATGHAVDWLRVPAAAERFLRAGPAAKMCRAIQRETLAPDTSALCVVSTAEPVVAAETRELCFRLRHELGRDPELVVVNRVPRRPRPDELFTARELARADSSWQPLADSLGFDAELQADARIALTALDGIAGARVVEVPELHRDPDPRDLIAFLGARP